MINLANSTSLATSFYQKYKFLPILECFSVLYPDEFLSSFNFDMLEAKKTITLPLTISDDKANTTHSNPSEISKFFSFIDLDHSIKPYKEIQELGLCPFESLLSLLKSSQEAQEDLACSRELLQFLMLFIGSNKEISNKNLNYNLILKSRKELIRIENVVLKILALLVRSLEYSPQMLNSIPGLSEKISHLITNKEVKLTKASELEAVNENNKNFLSYFNKLFSYFSYGKTQLDIEVFRDQNYSDFYEEYTSLNSSSFLNVSSLIKSLDSITNFTVVDHEFLTNKSSKELALLLSSVLFQTSNSSLGLEKETTTKTKDNFSYFPSNFFKRAKKKKLSFISLLNEENNQLDINSRQKNEKGIRILSFDGGGSKGLLSLSILKTLLKNAYIYKANKLLYRFFTQKFDVSYNFSEFYSNFRNSSLSFNIFHSDFVKFYSISNPIQKKNDIQALKNEFISELKKSEENFSKLIKLFQKEYHTEELSDQFSELYFEPYRLFHVIGGTSTGGIISSLLGIKKVTVKNIISLYENLIQKIFSNKSSYNLLKYKNLYNSINYDSLLLHICKNELLIDSTSSMFTPKVFFTSTKNYESSPYIFRNYYVGHKYCRSQREFKPISSLFPAEFSPNITSISQTPHHTVANSIFSHASSYEGTYCSNIFATIRACTAAPPYFSPVLIKGSYYYDGAINANNPSGIALEEAKVT